MDLHPKYANPDWPRIWTVSMVCLLQPQVSIWSFLGLQVCYRTRCISVVHDRFGRPQASARSYNAGALPPSNRFTITGALCHLSMLWLGEWWMCRSPKRCLSTTAGFRQALTASLCVPVPDKFLFRFQKLDVPLHRSWCGVLLLFTPLVDQVLCQAKPSYLGTTAPLLRGCANSGPMMTHAAQTRHVPHSCHTGSTPRE